MTPPLLGVEGDGQGNVSLLTEQNYLGLSDCSSVDSSVVTAINLNLKATELRLGLPGSQSHERETEVNLGSSKSSDEKQLFPSRSKRGFADTIDSKGFSEGNWMFGSSGTESDSSILSVQGKFTSNTNVNIKMSSGAQPTMTKDTSSKMRQGTSLNKVSSSNPPAPKAQVVGWPPVRNYRKNILATNSKNDEVDGKPSVGALFVKVSMDGAPYLRKVDLRSYTTYQELSSALEKMFSCFTLGQCGSQGGPGKESLSESKFKDLLYGSEYVLTYEDKDGDWMLVGDVPWDMFIGSCKRLKIMKGSDAIGLAPRATEKSKNKN